MHGYTNPFFLIFKISYFKLLIKINFKSIFHNFVSHKNNFQLTIEQN